MRAPTIGFFVGLIVVALNGASYGFCWDDDARENYDDEMPECDSVLEEFQSSVRACLEDVGTLEEAQTCSNI
jgi:hypothetical protein